MNSESANWWRKKDRQALTRNLWGVILVTGGLCVLVAARLMVP